MAGTLHASGYYTWDVPGAPLAVHLNLDVVDRMLAEVMRGFGAIPKRGAEVGGVLIGNIETTERTIVRIDDFKAVECAYRRGPSFLLDAEDRTAFEETVRRWQQDASRGPYAVGMFRSHTRDGMSPSPEDIEMMDDLLPSPSHVALLVRPYGTKVSIGGFFFREDGAFPSATLLEFPFRRQELTGEEAPPRRSMIERRPRVREPRSIVPSLYPDLQTNYEPVAEPVGPPGRAYGVTLPSRLRLRSAMWIPLSFVFLVLGLALGMMTSILRAPSLHADASDFSLGLSVVRTEDNLDVKWDRQSPAIRASNQGVLEIEDGSYTKSVDLKAVDLHSGSIIFRNSTGRVRFRLTVYPRNRVSVTQTAEWTK